MLKPIEADCLNTIAGIRHGFFTREGGVSRGLYSGLNCGMGSRDDSTNVIENRARVAAHLDAGGPEILTLYQVHGTTALAVDGTAPAGELPKADALLTKTPGLAIGVLTADCAPVLLADPEARVVGAAHAGWRGALAGILEAAVEGMEALGGERRRIRAAVGPAINQAFYEVGPEFEAEFLARDGGAGRFFFRPHAGARPHFDLPAFVAARLERAGIGAVETHAACTYRNESLFFSYRRSQHRSETDYGRQISAIVVT